LVQLFVKIVKVMPGLNGSQILQKNLVAHGRKSRHNVPHERWVLGFLVPDRADADPT
jgi:hypothetical protein